ncbi:MAG: hypothetical protein U0893_04205 [Chloroflexota bacterium]
MRPPEPKLTVAYYLKLALVSAGLLAGGGAIVYLSIVSGRIFPFVALVGGGLAIMGALGLLLVIGVPLLDFLATRCLFPHLERMARRNTLAAYARDREREQGPAAWRLSSDYAYRIRRDQRVAEGERVPPIPPAPEAIEARSAVQGGPPRRQAPPASAIRTSGPPSEPAPATPEPTPSPPGSGSEAERRPAPSTPRSIDTATPPPFATPPPPTPNPVQPPGPDLGVEAATIASMYRDLMTFQLLERRQALDGAAMGFVFQNLEIPEEIVVELRHLNTEISRRELAG